MHARVVGIRVREHGRLDGERYELRERRLRQREGGVAQTGISAAARWYKRVLVHCRTAQHAEQRDRESCSSACSPDQRAATSSWNRLASALSPRTKCLQRTRPLQALRAVHADCLGCPCARIPPLGVSDHDLPRRAFQMDLLGKPLQQSLQILDTESVEHVLVNTHVIGRAVSVHAEPVHRHGRKDTRPHPRQSCAATTRG